MTYSVAKLAQILSNFLFYFKNIFWYYYVHVTIEIRRLDSRVVFTLDFWTSVRYALGHEFEPRWHQMLYSWFYLVCLIWYYYLSVKFVMWIVKQKIENKRNLFLTIEIRLLFGSKVFIQLKINYLTSFYSQFVRLIKSMAS